MKIENIADLPMSPAVYALIGGSGGNAYVAYVGIAGKLRGRIRQHLVLRDSSVTTGTAATSLNPDYVAEVRWWEADGLDEKVTRHAAEVIAIEVLNPALRSRGTVPEEADRLSRDESFRRRFRRLFDSPPTGSLIVPTLSSALERVSALEARVRELEGRS